MEDEKAKLVKAIAVLADNINDEIGADEALKYTQAALNAAHTIAVLAQKA
jgi:hypothetical protein